MTEFSDLLGKVLTEVNVIGAERIEFVCEDGSKFLMYHSQDCCEYVSIESVIGDTADLIGNPVTLAERSSSSEKQSWEAKPEEAEYQYEDSFTWTFYKLATIKGYVDIRWYGSSNGYY